jgi:hypothetical protein
VPQLHKLEPQPTTLVDVSPADSNEEGESNIPNGERSGNQRNKALSLVFAEIAGTQGQLRSGKE